MSKTLLVAAAALALLMGCDQRTAEEKGRDLASEKLALVKGAGEVVRDQGKGVSSTVAEGVGNVFSGANQGLDASLKARKVVLAEPAAAASAVLPTRAQSTPDDKGISVYLVSDVGFDGSLRLVALAKGVEVGRAKAEVKLDKGDAKYLDFVFDERTPLTTADQFTLSVLAKR